MKTAWNNAKKPDDPRCCEHGECSRTVPETFDLCNFEIDGWMKLNYDTGSAKTVFPLTFEPGNTIETGEGKLRFRTASGEYISSSGGHRFAGSDEFGQLIEVKGVKAPVHKPLLSAGEIASKGSDTFLMGDYGYIIHRDSPIRAELRKAFNELVHLYDHQGIVTMVKENNVYNLYLKANEGDDTKELCPADQPEQSGFSRQGWHP